MSRGKSLYIREVNGKKYQEDIQPVLYVQDPKETNPKYKDIYGNPLRPIEFKTNKEKKNFIEKYNNSGYNIYGDIQPEYAYIAKKYSGDISFDSSQIKTLNIDIETENEHGGFPGITEVPERINAITVKFLGEDNSTTFACGEFKPIPNNTYVKCKNEEDLLLSFVKFWSENYPDIVTGWNVRFFDIPYTVNRIIKLFGETVAKKLSPWNILNISSISLMGREQELHDIFGVSVVDYIDLYKKFSFKAPENYKLDTIANFELGEKKLDYSEYGSLYSLYKNNFQKFIEYNIKDVHLVDRLEEKLRLIELAINLAYDSKVNFNDVFSQVKMWDCIIYNHLLSKNIIVPNKKIKKSDYTIAGGYVKEPKPGFQDWVVSCDATSLYPHLIMNFNISPDTITGNIVGSGNVLSYLNESVDTSKTENIVCANGQTFHKNFEGFLPELMRKMFKERDMYKSKMKDNIGLLVEAEKENKPEDEIKKIKNNVARYQILQAAKKVSLNSCFGATGNEYFRFFDNRIAEAITKTGQLSTMWIEKHTNIFLNKLFNTEGEEYVVYADTDSIYINLENLVKAKFGKEVNKNDAIDLLDNFSNKILVPKINSFYGKLSEYLNAPKNVLSVKREAIADRTLFQKKKRYILNIYDNEGTRYNEPKVKVQGIESVRSSTPTICREKIEEALSIILNGTERQIQEYILEFKKEFINAHYIDIAFPRTVKDLDKWSDSNGEPLSGTPIHVKGSLLYNKLLSGMDLKQYPKIYDGDKIKFIYLSEPNPVKSYVISFSETLPEEFDVINYIDRNLQFEKTFVDPLDRILQTVGWSYRKQNTLKGFFKKK